MSISISTPSGRRSAGDSATERRFTAASQADQHCHFGESGVFLDEHGEILTPMLDGMTVAVKSIWQRLARQTVRTL